MEKNPITIDNYLDNHYIHAIGYEQLYWGRMMESFLYLVLRLA